jgi:hypothetical protein
MLPLSDTALHTAAGSERGRRSSRPSVSSRGTRTILKEPETRRFKNRGHLARNRKFESLSLQRRVSCEPDFLDHGWRRRSLPVQSRAEPAGERARIIVARDVRLGDAGLTNHRNVEYRLKERLGGVDRWQRKPVRFRGPAVNSRAGCTVASSRGISRPMAVSGCITRTGSTGAAAPLARR